MYQALPLEANFRVLCPLSVSHVITHNFSTLLQLGKIKSIGYIMYSQQHSPIALGVQHLQRRSANLNWPGIRITLDTAVTVNYNWQRAASSTFGVHHEKKNAEEEKTVGRTRREKNTSSHTRSDLHMQFIVRMRTC